MADLYWLTLLSAIDGSILALAATGTLRTVGGAVVAGLTVLAGAGSWLAAHQAFAGRPGRRGLRTLAWLGVLTVAATLAAGYVGETLGQAVRLHVLPKAAGVAICLIAVEVAGLRLPRAARLPLSAWAIAAGLVLEVGLAWTL